MSIETERSNDPNNAPPRPRPRRELALEEPALKAAAAERSSDPYNTSGSFDRTKNWARVGKR